MLRRYIGLFWSMIAVGCSAGPGDIATDEGTTAEVQQAVASLPLYRRFGANTSQDWDHFYTTINGEGGGNYAPEGVLGYCEPTTTSSGGVSTVLLHRLWSQGWVDHFYTTDASEAAAAVAYVGFVDETSYAMPPCWVWPVQVAGTCPIYRMWSSGHSDHLYTNSSVEYNSLKNHAPQSYAPESTHAWYMVPGNGGCF